MNKTELNTLFTRETFIQAMRREKQRKKEWEEQHHSMYSDDPIIIPQSPIEG